MPSDSISSSNLLILSRIYERRANSLLYKVAQKTLEDLGLLPTHLIDREFISFLKTNGAREDDIRNWMYTNETVLNQLKDVRWRYDGRKDLIGYVTNKPTYYYIHWDDVASPVEVAVASLKGSGTIKPLMVYRQQEQEERRGPEAVHSKTIGHFGFLVPFIRKTTEISDFDRLREITEKFIYANWGALHRIRSQFQMEPRELGAGADGVAYAIAPNRVLKLFHSENAYKSSIAAIQRLWKHPSAAGTEAMIYDAGTFKPLEGDSKADTLGGLNLGKNTYYYIIERMTPARDVVDRSDLYDFLSALEGYAQAARMGKKEWHRFYYDPSVAPRIAPEIKKAAENIENRMRRERADTINKVEQQLEGKNLKSNWITRLAEEMIWKLITGRTDLHGGNLGITPYGELRYFDPVYE